MRASTQAARADRLWRQHCQGFEPASSIARLPSLFVCLMMLLPFAVSPAIRGAETTHPEDTSAYDGPTFHEGVNSFGPDSVDLLALGLNVRQELSAPFSVNGLQYQVVANYSGTGTDVKKSVDQAYQPVPGFWESRLYSYVHPETFWGPLGAGWSVHMGKLLSTGRVGEGGWGKPLQCGFDDDRDVYDGSPCECTLQYLEDRDLFNYIVEPSGIRHLMDYPVMSQSTSELMGQWPIYSVDFSWIRADLEPRTRPLRCHATLGWRTKDGTQHEINEQGLVTRITDLSGKVSLRNNWHMSS